MSAALIPSEELVQLILERVAIGSIPISTVRNMGPKLTMETAQHFLNNSVVLAEFSKSESLNAFSQTLASKTKMLQSLLPTEENKVGWRHGGYWGCARKCINIFLYECLLNRYLCDRYEGLKNLEPWLEVPLDSLVGTSLDGESENKSSIKPLVWDRVIGLTEDVSNRYQELAQFVANRKNICRVHLDAYYYRSSSLESEAGS